MHLCFSITAHGFGHGAISCAVINQFIAQNKNIKITVISAISEAYLTSRIEGKFDLINCSHDFGMEMHSAVKVNAQASAEKYRQLFKDWEKAVEVEKQVLLTLGPDCLISNISPISLAAAQQLKIPTASVAPFNWAQIYWAYCHQEENAIAIFNKMKGVYLQTDFIFKPQPSVPFDACKNEILIDSITSVLGKPNRQLLDLLPTNVKKVGLIALGGLPMSLDLSAWPKLQGWHWFVDQPCESLRDDMTQVNDIDLPFTMLISNSDLVLTKPGYGTYCEIASVAQFKKIRAMSLVRPDWPETPFLNKFLSDRVPFLEVTMQQLNSDQFPLIIEKLIAIPYPEAMPLNNGAEQLAKLLKNWLSPKNLTQKALSTNYTDYTD